MDESLELKQYGLLLVEEHKDSKNLKEYMHQQPESLAPLGSARNLLRKFEAVRRLRGRTTHQASLLAALGKGSN